MCRERAATVHETHSECIEDTWRTHAHGMSAPDSSMPKDLLKACVPLKVRLKVGIGVLYKKPQEHSKKRHEAKFEQAYEQNDVRHLH